jgi:hypothetical protein
VSAIDDDFELPLSVEALQAEVLRWRARALAAEQRLSLSSGRKVSTTDDDTEDQEESTSSSVETGVLAHRTDAVVSLLSRTGTRLAPADDSLPSSASASPAPALTVSTTAAFKTASVSLGSAAKRRSLLLGSGRRDSISSLSSSPPAFSLTADVPLPSALPSVVENAADGGGDGAAAALAVPKRFASSQELPLAPSLSPPSTAKFSAKPGKSTAAAAAPLADLSASTLTTVAKRDRSNTVVVEGVGEGILFFKDEASGAVEVKAGELSALVDTLTPDRSMAPDSTFIKEFLFSYRSFCKPRDLLLLLETRWLYIPSGGGGGARGDVAQWAQERAQTRQVVQMRVINVLRRWLEAHPVDFTDTTRIDDSGDGEPGVTIAEDLHRFLRVTVAGDKATARWSPILLALFHSRVAHEIAAPLLDVALPVEALVAAMARRDHGVRRVHADSTAHFLASDAVKWLAGAVSGAAEAGAGAACLQRMASARLISPLDARDEADDKAFVFADDATAASESESAAVLLKAPKSLFDASAGDDGQFEFDEFEPLEVARQLTLMSRNMFVEIEPTTINMRHADDMGEAVSRYIAHFNVISFWVASEIVLPSELQTRTRRLRLIVQVCEHLERLRDYNSLFAATAALHNASVNRLKQTWAGVGPGTHEHAALERLIDLTKPNNNYSNYRKQLQLDTRGQLPCIPYFGLYLKDLLHIEDGNDSTIKSPAGATMINFEKYRMLASVLEQIHDYQALARRYTLRAVPQIQEHIQNFDIRDDKELYKLSLLREARQPSVDAAAAASAAAPVAPASPGKGFLSRLRSKRHSLTGAELGLQAGATIEQVVRRRLTNEDETKLGASSGSVQEVSDDDPEPAIIIVKASDKKDKKKKSSKA